MANIKCPKCSGRRFECVYARSYSYALKPESPWIFLTRWKCRNCGEVVEFWGCKSASKGCIQEKQFKRLERDLREDLKGGSRFIHHVRREK